MNKASREVQYPYAFDESDNLVFIEDIKKDTRYDHKYHCPNCGHSMLPRLGDHNAHCFAHSENQACGVESYIHKMAKLILTKRFNDRSRQHKYKDFQAINKEDITIITLTVNQGVVGSSPT